MYDGMAFPEPSSFMKEIGKKVGTFLKIYKESDLEKPIPSHEQAQEESFHCFLQTHETTLTHMDFKAANREDLSEFVEHIFCVYEQLREQRTCYDKRASYSNPRIAPNLAEVRKLLAILS